MAKNFNEYKTAVQSNYSYPESFNATFKAPVIAKRIWATYADALGWINDPKDNAVVGLQISIINDTDPKKNGIYMVTKIGVGETDEAGNYIGGELEKVGSTPVLEATNYDEALTKAVDAPVGSLINVLNAQGSVENSNYRAAGFYIVSVNGSAPVILFLSTSTGESLDLDEVISKLSTAEGKIAALEEIVSDENNGLVKQVGDAATAASNAGELAEENSDRLDVLEETVGAPKKVGETPAEASGLYKVIDDAVAALEGKISAIPKFNILVVESLESVTEPSPSTVYLVTTGDEDNNLYTEYIYNNEQWEKLGTQSLDLSDYDNRLGEVETAVAGIDGKIAGVKITASGATGTYIDVGAKVDEATGREITLTVDETELTTKIGELDAFKSSMSGYGQFVTDTNTSLQTLNAFMGNFTSSTSITNGEVNTMTTSDIDSAIAGV